MIQLIEYYKARLRGLLANVFPGIKIGKRTMIEPGAKLRTQYGGTIKVGSGSIIYRNALLLTHGGDIVIGDNCTINPYTTIYGQGGVYIGNNVRIASHCSVIPANHIFSDPERPIFQQGLSKKGIVIEEDVWMGSGVKILDGVTVSKGCVIGANSVVTKSTQPYGVYVGVPAHLLKSRNKIFK